MTKTQKNSTRRKYSRVGKYVKKKYSKKKYSKKKYSKNKYRKSKRKQHNNRKRNMKGGLVTLKNFENDEEIIVLREDDEETETPEGSLVIRDDDMVVGSESAWLEDGDFEAQQMKGWIMNALNKDGYFPRIENPDDIQLYKGGKSIGDLFTGVAEEDAENDITIYVKLPPRLVTGVGELDAGRQQQLREIFRAQMSRNVTDQELALLAPDKSSAERLIDMKKVRTANTQRAVDRNISHLEPKSQVPTKLTRKLTPAEKELDDLKSEALIEGMGFIGTGIIKMYINGDCDLEQLKSFYDSFIKDENINQKDGVGFTMINLAVEHNLYPIIEFLLNIPEIIINGNNKGDNPLLYSIYMINNGYEEFDGMKMINFLLNQKKPNGEYMFDINIVDTDNYTPLERAISYLNKDLVELLINGRGLKEKDEEYEGARYRTGTLSIFGHLRREANKEIREARNDKEKETAEAELRLTNELFSLFNHSQAHKFHPLEVTEMLQVDDEEERRVDPVDGQEYTLAEFIEEYGGTTEWEAAGRMEEEAAAQADAKGESAEGRGKG